LGPTVLLVEDDVDVVRVVRAYLEREGFAVQVESDGESGLRRALADPPALVLLDWMLPRLSGLDVLRRLRQTEATPVILLTARNDELDRVIGLELGADDYVAKPFNPRELLARIRAVLRRAGGEGERAKEPPPKEIHFAGWTLEPSRRRLVDPQGTEVSLTGGEYELLTVLVERPNRVLTRDMLMDLLHGRQAGQFDRAIDVAVSRLRRKLEDDGRNPSLIKTVRGGGYVLAATVDRAS
jgi:two-component system, OmpR family, response regulator